ncbi:MAG: PorT family protein [Bacteroidaceae bacterium]|nr:PorT family protein [Bacteroidaceae bacterium]
MKKVITTILLFCMVCMSSGAQEFRAGMAVGMNVNSPSYFDTFAGYNVGLRGEVSFNGMESGAIFDLGLLLSDKGWRYKFGEMASIDTYGVRDVRLKAHPTYLDIPLHAGYRWQVSPKLRLFASAGPTIGIGLFGKEKMTYESAGGHRNSRTLVDNVFDNTMERLDVALGYRVGMEFKHEIQLSVSQDWGLRNFDKGSSDIKIRNRSFSLGLTFMF